MERLTETGENRKTPRGMARHFFTINSITKQMLRDMYCEQYDKLQAFEDLEEQIGMPLDIFVNVLTNRIGIWYIDGNNIISYCIDGFKNGVFYAEDYCRGCRMDDILFNPADYGIFWFLTYEEAEKKLEEMKNETCR